jgi:GTP-binding protein
MATQRHPPPAVNGRRIKPKYMAQTKARPPTFVLFCTRADQLPESYRRYMINSIRESFDLPGVPIRVTVKSGSNPFVAEEGARPWLTDQGRGGPTISARKPNTNPKLRYGKAKATPGPAPAAPSTPARGPSKSVGKPSLSAAKARYGKAAAKPAAKSRASFVRSRPAKPGTSGRPKPGPRRG